MGFYLQVFTLYIFMCVFNIYFVYVCSDSLNVYGTLNRKKRTLELQIKRTDKVRGGPDNPARV